MTSGSGQSPPLVPHSTVLAGRENSVYVQAMTEMHSFLKFIVVALAAALATCACFYLMLFLISSELSVDVEIATPSHIHPAIAEKKEVDPIAIRRKPQKMLPLQPPPDPQATAVNKTARVEMKAERPTFGSIADLIGPEDINLHLEAPHSELMPVNVVQPVYPLRAAMKEVEGYVLVEFSVRENGTVANPIIVESEPRLLFDEAALNAVTRFKFKPREIGGDRVRVDNVQLRFAFNLESLYDVDYASSQ